MIILIAQSISVLFTASLIHEAGHALACRLYGIRIIEIMIWSGSPRHRLQMGRLAIGWFPYGGYVATPFIDDDVEDFIITLCGPVANIIVGMGIFFSSGMIQVFCSYNLLMAVNALLPIGGKKDGYRLLLIIKKWYSIKKQYK